MIGIDVLDLDLAGVQKAEMRRVDVALQGLQPIALAHDASDVDFLGRTARSLDSRQWRRHLALAHIDIDDPATLRHLIGFRFDFVTDVLVLRRIRHIEAVAGSVELPAVIDTPQPAFLITPEEQRGAAVRAAVVEDPDPTWAVAEGEELLPHQHQA